MSIYLHENTQKSFMDKYDIHAHIKRSKTTLTEIANSFDPPISVTAISRVIAGIGTSRRIAEKISDITGKPINKMWPGKYDKKHTIRHKKTKEKS